MQMKKIFAFLFLSSSALMSTEVAIGTIAVDKSTNEKLEDIRHSAFSTKETLINTYQLAVACIRENIPGDFVECGVAAGAQSAVMAYVCQQLGSDRNVHMFDSFQGIPIAGPNDDQQPGIGQKTSASFTAQKPEDFLVSSGVDIFSPAQVKANMDRWGLDNSRFVYHVGWFQNTLPLVTDKIKQISFLRLDGDLYESTKVCLEHLYSKISMGGYIVIDDYALPGCAKAVNEYLAKHNLKPRITPVRGGNGVVYWQID